MTDLTTIFKNHKAFIAFVVAGDPNFEATVDQVVALAEAGCDLVEIGIPFSDPVADGPEIQAADLRAFDQHITPQRVFELVVAIREKTTIPLVFFNLCEHCLSVWLCCLCPAVSKFECRRLDYSRHATRSLW